LDAHYQKDCDQTMIINGKSVPVYTNWHGGYNYGYAVCGDDFEEFPNLAAAKREFWHRRFSNDAYYPGVDDSCFMDIYLKDDDGTYEPYTRFTIGRRQSVVRENY